MMIVRVSAAMAALGAAGVAMAVGDLPTKLTRRQAAAEYARARGFLAGGERACPIGQVAVSGGGKGGPTPTAGSRTVTIFFDKGAVVKIARSWNGAPGREASASVTVSCDPHPARRDVDMGRLTGDGNARPATCAMIAQSLRVPQSAECLRSSPEPTQAPGAARPQ